MNEQPRPGNQKLKLLYLLKILYEQTDEEHSLNANEIEEKLAEYGISANRKTIYDDVKALEAFGIDVISGRGKKSGYRLVGREFQLAELNLIANAVSSSKFLTEKKAKELLQKIGKLASSYEGKQIQREVYIPNRPRATNEHIYYCLDAIHKAIAEKKKISFNMFDYDLHKKTVVREGIRVCSPYALTWSEERYYLVAYYDKYDTVSNFRVDRMDNIQILDEAARKKPSGFSLSEHLNSTFSMFSGESEEVRLRFDNSLVNAVIDRFGKEVPILPQDDEHFDVIVKIKTEQPQPFFGWMFKFGTKVKIVEPEYLKNEYREMLAEVMDNID